MCCQLMNTEKGGGMLVWDSIHYSYRAKFFLFLRSLRIDSKESIPPACVAWRAGTTALFLLGSYFLAPIDCLKIPCSTVLVDPHISAPHQNSKYKYDISFRNVLRTLQTFMLLSWWCSFRAGKGHMPTRHFIKMNRLITVSTHLFFIL